MSVSSTAAIPPVPTPLEAEAIALKLAVQEMAKFQYHDVVFVGDCKILFDTLQNWKQSREHAKCPVQVKGETLDISNLNNR